MSPDFDQPSAPVPLDDLHAIRSELRAVRRVVNSTVVRQDAQDRGQLEILRRLEEHGKALAKNTEVTEQVRDLWTTGRVGTKFLLWLGSIAAALTALVALWFALPKH